jgi:hypothetical protein
VPDRSCCSGGAIRGPDVTDIATGRVAHGPAQPSGVVVSGAQLGIAQPVVGDVDPFRPLEAGIARDIGMVLTEERAPGDLDDLGPGVDRDLEPGVEVVGGE